LRVLGALNYATQSTVLRFKTSSTQYGLIVIRCAICYGRKYNDFRLERDVSIPSLEGRVELYTVP